MNIEKLHIGDINGHAVGVIMKELVRRAVTIIRALRDDPTVTEKPGYGGDLTDLFTSADTAAQEVYLRKIRECFPNVGIIAEEEALKIEGKEGVSAYFTIDPLDGTKAFVRNQSHSIGSMIALARDGEVLSAFVGDINTKEIYGFRPGSDKVHRITEYETARQLGYERQAPLKEGYALLRDPEKRYSPLVRGMLESRFKSHIIDGGSIGIWLSRLWKREVVAAILLPSFETPWDSTPIIGISLKLGYKFLRPTKCGGYWEVFEPVLPTETYLGDHEVLIVHEHDLNDMKDILA